MSVARCCLPARLDLSAAGPLAAELRTRLGTDLALDAGKTTHLGTPGLQVLLAARRSWTASGHRLVLENVGDDLAAQLAVFGLAPDDLDAPHTPDPDDGE